MSRLILRTARPTEGELELLRAAVLSGPPARAAYDAWIATHNPREVEPRSRALLPPLHRNLLRLGVEDRHTADLRGVWLHTWATNARLLQAATRALSALHNAGLPTVLLKGAALIAAHVVADPGSRVLGDVDVLVPFGGARTAADALAAAGWELVAPRSFEVEWKRGHSTAFADERGSQIDLHWRATFDPADDGPLIDRRVPTVVGEIATSVPTAADQLVLACLHGVGWHAAPVRWIADGTMIVHRHPELDWDLVIAEARRRQAAHRIASQLELLHQLMDVPVPQRVIGSLRRDRLTVTERVLQRAKESPHWGSTIYLCSWDRARRARALPDPVAEPYMTFAMIDLGLTRRRELVWRMLSSPFRYLFWIVVQRPKAAK